MGDLRGHHVAGQMRSPSIVDADRLFDVVRSFPMRCKGLREVELFLEDTIDPFGDGVFIWVPILRHADVNVMIP